MTVILAGKFERWYLVCDSLPIGQDPALEITTKLPFDVGRNPLSVPVIFPCQIEAGLQMLLHDLVQGCCPGMAAAIGNRLASL
jgi:hypothetical protein